MDAVDELKGPVRGLIDGAAGKDAPWLPAMQMEDMREPGVDLRRVGADVGQFDELIHRIDAGKNHVELGTLNVDVEKIDRFRQKVAQANSRRA